MSEHGKIDRRMLLKIMGATGATGAVFSTSCGEYIGTTHAESSGITGGRWDRVVKMASSGPGGKSQLAAGRCSQFLPPEKIPTSGKAADLLGEPA